MKPGSVIPEGTGALEALEICHSVLSEHEAQLRLSPNQRLRLQELGHWLLDPHSDQEAQAVLEEAYELMDEIAPAYTFFGTDPGHGADHGFWVDWERIEEDSASGELPPHDTVAPDYQGFALEVSDHGNTTLYAHDGQGNSHEVWAIV